MNTHRTPCLARKALECLFLLAAASLLLRATWLPVVEIKGFDTFALVSVAAWATRAARVTLIVVILCLPIRPLGIARWWMALAVGILIGPLADMAVRTVDLVDMMKTGGQGDFSKLIVIRTGTWICAAGLACWLLDLVLALGGLICRWRRSGCSCCRSADDHASPQET